MSKMWKIKCEHCDEVTLIDELHPVDQARNNTNMVTTTECSGCGRRLEVILNVVDAEGCIIFECKSSQI